MPEITFLIPVAPYHSIHVNRAVESVRNQTIPCEYIVYEDVNERGAGYARNRLLEKCDSPFCTFLDADDEVMPEFAELSLKVWAAVRKPKRYVYTNWHGLNDNIFMPSSPCELWRRLPHNPLTFHLITTFLPTDYARAVGGFDEVLPENEDADFYTRLKIAGYCGIHLNEALVRYGDGGQRSINGVIYGGTETYLRDYYPARFGNYERILDMGCCGEKAEIPATPQGEKQEGDVLAIALWAGNRQERSYVQPGRIYPRASMGKQVWVNPGDIAARPGLWRKAAHQETVNSVVLPPRYQEKVNEAPPAFQWGRGADAALGGGKPSVSAVTEEAHNHYQPMVSQAAPAETVKKARGRVKRS